MTFSEPIVLILSKNRVGCTDGVYPYSRRGWRTQRARICQDLARTENPVRADRRLRTDDEAIRAQSTIWA
jgi:hypothetical protein